MWEVPIAELKYSVFSRITPTYVGSTFRRLKAYWESWDHPHVCGKYPLLTEVNKTIKGSPPRMWEVLSPHGL